MSHKISSILRKGLAAVIAAALFAGMNAFPFTVFADDEISGENGAEQIELYAQEGEGGYTLTASTPALNFGTVNVGDYSLSKNVTIYNAGPADVILQMYGDWNNYFEVTGPAVNALPAGGSLTFTVAPDVSLSPGQYDSEFYFTDIDDVDTVPLTVSASFILANPKPDRPVITSVSVVPGNVSVSKGGQCGFSALVYGSGDYDSSVSWGVSGNTSIDTYIDESGVLRVAPNEGGSNLSVSAMSNQDRTKVGNANAAVQAGSYTVSVQANPAEGGAVSGGGVVNEGGSTTVKASANNGFDFTGWSINGSSVSTAATYQISNVKQNITVVANFTRKTFSVNLAVNPEKGGSVSGGGSYTPGTNTSLKATPNAGYKFLGWLEDGKYISNNATMSVDKIDKNHSITAVFQVTGFHVVASVYPTGGGSVTGAGTFDPGKDVTLKASAQKGYQFVGWSSNGSIIDTAASHTVKNLSCDIAITAVFQKEGVATYTIKSGVSGKGGTIAPAGSVAVEVGKNVSFGVSPASGYHISDVQVDGKSVGAVQTYTFNNVSGAHTINAVFAADAVKEPEKPEDPVQPEQPADGSVLEEFGMSVDEARAALREGRAQDMLQEAYQRGFLSITVNNEYSENLQATADGSFFSEPSIPNFGEVFSGILTEDDLLAALNGQVVSVNVSICDSCDDISEKDKADIDKLAGRSFTVGCYMDIVVMKTVSGISADITGLSVPMQIKLDVPAEMRADGREFSVLRVHRNENGNDETAVLSNLSSEENTIIFETDCFSAYAIVYESAEGVNPAIVIAAIASVLLLAMLLIIIRGPRRRARRNMMQ